VDALIDDGTLIRWLHVASAAAFTGLLLVVDWHLTPAALRARGEERKAVAALALPILASLRWSGALAWVLGMTYALGFLARQDPEGTAHWLSTNTRGQWIALSFAYASIAVSVSWFVLAPLWEALARGAVGDDDGDTLLATAARAARGASCVLPALIFAMSAGKHLGETGGDLPTEFGLAGGAVTVGGIALGLILGAVFGRRS